jgi:FkbM family methyltransferase
MVTGKCGSLARPNREAFGLSTHGSFLAGFARRARRILGPASPLEVERAEQRFFIGYLRPGMVVFDVGAHIGELTLLFSRFVGPQGTVHAFEASSAVYRRLQAVCALSGRKNILLNHMALLDREGAHTLHVYDDDHSTWNTLASRALTRYHIDIEPIGQEIIQSTTLDNYCTLNRIPYIDLLKIDVEGAEYQVLLGAKSLLENKRVGCCTFEFGATTFDMGNTPAQIMDFLRAMDYRTRNLVRRNRAFPGGRSAESARFSIHIATPRL